MNNKLLQLYSTVILVSVFCIVYEKLVKFEYLGNRKMSTVIPLITKLSARVMRVLGCNPGPMTLQGTNTYIIGTGSRRILLDTSDADKPDYIAALAKVLNEEGVKIEKVLFSHWHHDHVGGAPAIAGHQKLTADGCTFHKIPRTDEENESYGVPILTLENGQSIKADGATLKVIHTPGHTTDHTAFWLEEERALFTGDCVLGEGTTVLETLSDYMRSLHLMLSMDAAVLYPGHGPHVTESKRHITEYIVHREKREKQILECLRDVKDGAFVSEMFIVSEVYKGLPEHLFLPARVNVNNHLVKLEEDGLVQQNSEGDWCAAPLSGKL